VATTSVSPAWLIWTRRHLLYIIGATVVIFLTGMFFLTRSQPDAPTLETPNRIPRDRLNVPPSTSAPATPPASAKAEESIQEDVPASPETTPPTTPANADRYAIIAVGLFGDETNVQKMLARIERVDMEPFTSREGRLTRVGVQVRYQQESELAAALQRVKARIEDRAFVMEKEGKRVQSQ
jgi:hypothetical protein